MKESETAIWTHRTGTMQMKQQRAALEKRNASRNKIGDAVGRPSRRSSLLGDPGAKFLVETGHRNRTTKNSLNYVSTCLKVVLRRRSLASAKIHGLTAFPSHRHGLSLMLTMWKRRLGSLNREDIECSSRTRKKGPNGHSLHLTRRIAGWCHFHSIDAG